MGVFFDDGFLQKYDTIWDKVRADIKKEFDSKAVSKHILKIKMKSDKAIDFNDKGISKVDSNHTCLAVINFDSALNKDRNYYIF